MDEITPLSQEKCLYFALVLISMQIYALVYCKVMRYNVESSRAGSNPTFRGPSAYPRR